MTTIRPMNRRILVVDDNQSIHDDFRAILAPDNQSLTDIHEEEAAIFGDTTGDPVGESFEVDGAFQGEEALAMARTALDEGRPYALAFVDMRMPPGWDGVTTIEKLWESCPELETVICTAYSDHDWHSITERLGTTSQLLILKKPYDNIEILQFATALTEKWNLARTARQRETLLKKVLAERTAELATANRDLEQFAYVFPLT
jgi:CheY-like chemotaxis protein